MNRVSSLQDVLLLILFIHFTFKKYLSKNSVLRSFISSNFYHCFDSFRFFVLCSKLSTFSFSLLKFYPLYIELNKTLNKLQFSSDSRVGWNCFWGGFLKDGMYSLIGWLDQTPDLWRFSDWFLKITIFDLECVITSWRVMFITCLSL